MGLHHFMANKAGKRERGGERIGLIGDTSNTAPEKYSARPSQRHNDIESNHDISKNQTNQ